jgi:hypothetical protein
MLVQKGFVVSLGAFFDEMRFRDLQIAKMLTPAHVRCKASSTRVP